MDSECESISKSISITTKSTKSTIINNKSTLKTRIPKRAKKRIKSMDPRAKKTNMNQAEGLFDRPGISKIILSPLTQKIIGCVIGEHVTVESPWLFLKKEVIEDNLELHQKSSEFLPLMEEIKNYPEPEILLRYVATESHTHDVFYLVHDIDTKTFFLEHNKNEQIQLETVLKNSINRPIGRWESLGSEEEISESIVSLTRPLYSTVIKSKFPITNKKVTFRMRKVEDAIDGYVELLQDKAHPIQNVIKKRLDVSIQANPLKISNESQTNSTFPTNVWTQYEYKFEEKETNDKAKEDIVLKSFITQTFRKNLEDIIDTNKSINMHVNDYSMLKINKMDKIDNSGETKLFRYYYHVTCRRGKIPTDMSWNKFISGYFASNYVDYGLSTISHGHNALDEVNEATYNCAPVLIWNYTDSLYPVLFLETPRDITFLSFSPYDKDVLVGGCKTGEIIIWDLMGKIDDHEKVQILTAAQRKNRKRLHALMNWTKNNQKTTVIQPKIFTSLANSHTDIVSCIVWLNPYWCMSPLGVYRHINKDEDKTNQFYTCSHDGSILFWDLKQNASYANNFNKNDKKIYKRLSQTPSALRRDTSELSKFGDKFAPHYKLIIKDNDFPVPITSVLKKTSFLTYEPLEKTNLKNPEVSTHYKIVNEDIQVNKSDIIIGTSNGKIAKLFWDGFTFLSESIHTETLNPEFYQTIHDGPILTCISHPYKPELFLTLGGHVFALWYTDETKPLFWRKSPAKGCKYMAGGWSIDHGSFMILVRSDGAIEIWDFISQCSAPIRTMTYGVKLQNILGLKTSQHCRKNTFALTDTDGSIHIYYVPELLKIRSGSSKYFYDVLFKTSFARTTKINNWISQFKKTDHSLPTVSSTRETIKCTVKGELKLQTDVEKIIMELNTMNRIFENQKWNSNHEELMYQIMLERKKLNVDELRKQKKPLEEVALEKKRQLKKQALVLKNKEKIFENATIAICTNQKNIKTRKYSLEHSIENTMLQYLEEYDEIEKNALKYMKIHQFHYSLDWAQTIETLKASRKAVKEFSGIINLHTRRKFYNIIEEHKVDPKDKTTIFNIYRKESKINLQKINQFVL